MNTCSLSSRSIPTCPLLTEPYGVRARISYSWKHRTRSLQGGLQIQTWPHLIPSDLIPSDPSRSDMSAAPIGRRPEPGRTKLISVAATFFKLCQRSVTCCDLYSLYGLHSTAMLPYRLTERVCKAASWVVVPLAVLRNRETTSSSCASGCVFRGWFHLATQTPTVCTDDTVGEQDGARRCSWCEMQARSEYPLYHLFNLQLGILICSFYCCCIFTVHWKLSQVVKATTSNYMWFEDVCVWGRVCVCLQMVFEEEASPPAASICWLKHPGLWGGLLSLSQSEGSVADGPVQTRTRI